VIECNFAVIRMAAEPFGKRRRRRVGIVGIVQVKPDKEGRTIGAAAPCLLRDPVLRQLPRPVTASLDVVLWDDRGPDVETIVVLVESARQTRSPVEDERADECCGSIAPIMEGGR